MQNNIAVLCLNNIGDGVMLSSCISALSENLSGVNLVLIAKPPVCELYAKDNRVGAFIPYTCSWFPGPGGVHDDWEGFFRTVKQIRKLGCKTAINTVSDVRSNLLARLGGIRHLISGYGRHGHFISSKIVGHELIIKHEVERHLELASAMTGCNVKKHPLHISISLEDVLSAIALKKAVGNIEDCPLVAIHPCANAVFKEWPLDRFAEIGRHLVKNKKCRIAILGAAGRDELLADILAKRIGSGVVDISGKTPFRTLLAFLKLCDMYIGNDSGPMHLAAAAGCPTVAIFGATNPTRFGHYLPDRLKRVVVSSEFSHSYAVNASQMGEIMLRTVSVKMVTDAIDDLWSIVFDRLKSRSNGQNNDL